MKVSDLRKELDCRSLSSKGLKSQLIARLTKQLKVEEQVEESKEPEKIEPKVQEEEEPVRTEEDREEEERKKQEDLERQRRERRYILPDEPTILVNPNWAAKSGKFDCSVMSLSVLLDYRLEDNKEHSFEVSLFAELFNEMLQRDFGYRIYKSLAVLPSKDEKKEKEKKAKKESDKKDSEKREIKREESDEPVTKKAKEDEEDKDKRRSEDKVVKKEESKDEEDNEDDSSTANAEEYDPMEAEDDDDDDDKDDADSNGRDKKDRKDDRKSSKERSSKDKEKKQMVTYNRELLMAFVYFDQSHCGYLLERDLEEILYTLGLHLSRAQIKKLLNKPVVRESCHYRKLTDRGKDEPTPAPGETTTENLLGNRALLPSTKARPQSSSSSSSASESGNLIVYNGAMVDVGSMMQKLERSEKAREEIEQKLFVQDNKMEEDVKAMAKLEEANSALSKELEEVKEALRSTEETLKSTEETKTEFHSHISKTSSTLLATVKELLTVLKKDSDLEEAEKLSNDLENCTKPTS